MLECQTLTNMKKNKVSEIKCNGIGFTTPANSVKPTIQTMVSLYKMRHDKETIIDSLQKLEKDYYYFGERCECDKTITDRIATGLVEYFRNGDSEMPEESTIEKFVNSLTAAEIDILILEGIRDCASADYYYKFEK